MSTYFPTTSQLSAPPQVVVFTPIRRFQDEVICIGLIDLFMLDHQSHVVDLSSFTVYLSSLDLMLQQLLGNLSKQDIDIDFWISALQTGTVEVVLDGLVKEGCRTYTVVFQSGDKFIQFQGPVDCHPSLLQGFSIDIFECEVTAYVDNIMAVNTNNQKKCFPGIAAHTALDIDLSQEIWALQ
eukprot:8514137-Ditylum_brightwellii.AAC.1